MNAVALQIPGHEADEFIIARDRPEYVPLPALNITLFREGRGLGMKGVLTRWRPSDEERAALANGADIWLETMTFGDPMQPVRISTECPINPEAQG